MSSLFLTFLFLMCFVIALSLHFCSDIYIFYMLFLFCQHIFTTFFVFLSVHSNQKNKTFFKNLEKRFIFILALMLLFYSFSVVYCFFCSVPSCIPVQTLFCLTHSCFFPVFFHFVFSYYPLIEPPRHTFFATFYCLQN